ncbi:MAG: hypothetical protein H6711_22925 [Myxococcales bacterium]|nr:hypothetical protein [Myxococcales bacterium]
MSKPEESIQDLRRRLVLLDRLRGRALPTADGLALFEVRDPPEIRDPEALWVACARGWPSAAAIAAAVELEAPPAILRPSLLAAMQRNLKALRKWPGFADFVAESPRIFRRFGALGPAWVAARQAELAAVSEAARAHEASLAGPATDGDAVDDGAATYARARALIAALRGEEAAAAIDGALERVRDDSRRRRRLARRRVAELLAALADPRERAGEATELRAAVDALRSADHWPGRGRRRRIEQIVARLLDLQPRRAPIEGPRAALADEVRAVAEGLVATIQPTRGDALLGAARRVLALYGLAFDPRPRGGGPLVVSPAAIERGQGSFARVRERFGGLALTVDEVLRLLALRIERGERAIAALVAGGLALDAVADLAARDRLADLLRFEGEPAAAAAYARWYLTLAPHFAALGLEVPVLPELFKRLGDRKAELGALALCLMSHRGQAGSIGADAALARLDGTLALFQRRPAEADALLSALAGGPPGAGRAAFPELAAWLGDDPLLDRYVHLCGLVGREVALSRRLRADFERGAALARERAHLEDMSERTDKQDLRLARLVAGEVPLPDPAWTRRRLAEENEALLGLAHDALIDRAFRRIVGEAWGITLATLTPAWRDAIRFYLATERNHELLRVVLRAAAAGRSLLALPKNQAWIAAARERFAVDAWLKPRRREVAIGDQPCVLEIERDPVEVLRMGVPFDTCLSISGGFNAASTVINAADANKAVIYLRDRRGKIVARKLIAVSKEDALIGYRLYIADRERAPEIRRVFAALCDEVAEETGLPMSVRGAPEQLHEGFWYDDGTEPFDGSAGASDDDVPALCAALGLPPPPRPDDKLLAEAALFAALGRGEVDPVIAALREANAASVLRERAFSWLEGQIGTAALRLALPGDPMVIDGLFAEAARGDPRALLRAADERGGWRICNRLGAVAPVPGLASLLVESALARRRRGERFDDHELEHRSLDLLPRWIATEPLALALHLAARIAPVWGWVAESEEFCRSCVSHGEDQLIDGIAAGYRARPDPETLRQALLARRLDRLPRRAALRIAATQAIPGKLGALARALQRLARREPWIEEEPDLVAALLRDTRGALPHGVTLPKGPPPFELLGELCLVPAIAAHLTPWLERVVDPDAWRPGPWELALHRRRATPQRAALIAAAARRAPRSSEAALWLARLGDAEALEAIYNGPPGPDAERPGPKVALTLHQALIAARELAAQPLDSAEDLAGLPIAQLRSARNALGDAVIDPLLRRQALASSTASSRAPARPTRGSSSPPSASSPASSAATSARSS